MGSIAQFYRQQLKVPANKHAIEYLKNRGLSGEIVQKFGIGYIADEWDLVRRNFGQQRSSEDMLVTAGMLIENDNGRRYDRFRGRVMFPIRDLRGRVIGFGGRVIGEGTLNILTRQKHRFSIKVRSYMACMKCCKLIGTTANPSC